MVPNIMQLTDAQRATIIAWADHTPEVRAVILFGSRATKKQTLQRRGPRARNDGRPRQGPACDYFTIKSEIWKINLAADLGLPVHLGLLDPPWVTRCPPTLPSAATSCGGERHNSP
jgi:hypothetical protein